MVAISSQPNDFFWLLLFAAAFCVFLFIEHGKTRPDKIGIKITCKGKRVYERIPDESKQRLPNWLLIIYVIIALAVICVPLHFYLNRN
jgi:hypothetical protein